MRHGIGCLFTGVLAVALSAASIQAEEGWIVLFDGKSLEGWKASERPENWTVEDGAIVGRGKRSHLFYLKRKFKDFEFKAEVMINPGGNSGMYFRTQWGPGWPKGYEAQVNNTHRDPRKTGSLYGFVDVRKQLVKDNQWFTQHVTVRGNHIVIRVNGKVVVDFVDPKHTYKEGYIALQQHDPGTVVRYRKIMVKPLD